MDDFKKLSTKKRNEAEAVKDLRSQVEFYQESFSVLFFSSSYDSKTIRNELEDSFSKNVIAISTAGEIANGAYLEGSISGFSIDLQKSDVEPFLIQNINEIEHSILEQLKSLVESIKLKTSSKNKSRRILCLVLVDGLSGFEEILMEFLADTIKDIPIVGGSSGDGLSFGNTSLIYQGQNYNNAACLLFISTDTPFEIVKTQHFKNSNKKIVITAAEPAKRKVTEINGLPAAVAYADILGMDVDHLNPDVFSQNPLALKIGDSCFIRSIRSVNPDQSLTFYCAIENGIVLSLAQKDDVFEATKADLYSLREKLVSSSFSIFFECILRRLEVAKLEQKKKDELFKLYNDVNAIGFHTYGEQLGSVHINQTLTGVMFGRK